MVKCGKVTFTVLSTRDREGEERRRWRRNAQELKQTWIFSPPGVIQVAFKAAHKERGGRVCVETENHSLVDLGPGPRGNDLGDIRVA